MKVLTSRIGIPVVEKWEKGPEETFETIIMRIS